MKKKSFSPLKLFIVVSLLIFSVAVLSGCGKNNIPEEGTDDRTPYEIACEGGFSGSFTEWLESLTDENGKAPMLRVQPISKIWEISYDKGKTWTALGARAAGTDDSVGNAKIEKTLVDTMGHLWIILSDGTRIDAGSTEEIATVTPEEAQKLSEIKSFVLTKQASNCEIIGPVFLHQANENGIYSPVSATAWTSGFYPGLNYLCYEMSGNLIFKQTNDKLLENLSVSDTTGMGHDIGMVFSPSTYADYTLFRDSDSKAKTIAAGEALMARFCKEGGYIKAWDWGGEINKYRMIIDTMYNLPLLYRCYELTGNKEFYDVAVAHSKTAQKYLVRNDYTTAHTYIFNPDGTPSHQKTHQGYADDSCWARGQAWAITGFAMAYRFTGDESFLETSICCAGKFLELTESNLIPKWDLVFKGDAGQPVDTSAAAIIGNGFMELYDITGHKIYRDFAYRILVELYENYSSKDNPAHQGLIKEAVGHKPENKNVSVSLIYGDYFFVELLSRMLGTSKGYW